MTVSVPTVEDVYREFLDIEALCKCLRCQDIHASARKLATCYHEYWELTMWMDEEDYIICP